MASCTEPMATDTFLQPLVDRRPWVYAGGIAAIVAVRSLSLPRTVHGSVVILALSLMILTYFGERIQDRTVSRPGLLLLGAGGIVAGVALTISGTTAGLAFVAGGLLFLEYSLDGGEPT